MGRYGWCYGGKSELGVTVNGKRHCVVKTTTLLRVINFGVFKKIL